MYLFEYSPGNTNHTTISIRIVCDCVHAVWTLDSIKLMFIYVDMLFLSTTVIYVIFHLYVHIVLKLININPAAFDPR